MSVARSDMQYLKSVFNFSDGEGPHLFANCSFEECLFVFDADAKVRMTKCRIRDCVFSQSLANCFEFKDCKIFGCRTSERSQ